MGQLKKIKDIIVYKDENYCSFPNAIVLDDGMIMVSFRQAPDWQKKYNDVTHGDPSSIGVFVKSFDNGKTWSSKPELIYRHYLLRGPGPVHKLSQQRYNSRHLFYVEIHPKEKSCDRFQKTSFCK